MVSLGEGFGVGFKGVAGGGFPVGKRGKTGRGWGGRRGTGKSIRTRLSKLSFRNLPFNISPT